MASKTQNTSGEWIGRCWLAVTGPLAEAEILFIHNIHSYYQLVPNKVDSLFVSSYISLDTYINVSCSKQPFYAWTWFWDVAIAQVDGALGMATAFGLLNLRGKIHFHRRIALNGGKFAEAQGTVRHEQEVEVWRDDPTETPCMIVHIPEMC